MPPEPTVMINGVQLTEGQAMTLRCAMESFSSYLQPPYILGDDTHGVTMRTNYLARITEIRKLMRY